MFKHKIVYNGQTLLFFTTNCGSLFSVRTLLSARVGKYLNNYYVYKYVKPELCVTLDTCSAHGTLCTGLEGFRQIFADNPDKTLEQILIKYGIVTGDLPYAKDIKLVHTKVNVNYDISCESMISSYNKKVAYKPSNFNDILRLCDKLTYNYNILFSAFDFLKATNQYELNYKRYVAKFITQGDIVYEKPLQKCNPKGTKTRLYVDINVLQRIYLDFISKKGFVSVDFVLDKYVELQHDLALQKEKTERLENELHTQAKNYETTVQSLEKQLRIAKTLC